MSLSPVILEGPDGAGKTTLARWLVGKHGYQYHHEGPPPPGKDVFVHYARMILDLTADPTAPPVVMDRAFHGELVYGPVVRGSSRINEHHLRLLRRLTQARGVTEILVLPPVDTILARWRAANRPELLRTEHEVRWVHGLYASLPYEWDARLTDLPLNAGFDPLLLRPKPTLPDRMLGCAATGRFLFVGEKPGEETGLDLPFFSIHGSSRYLNTCLQEAGYQENELIFQNALPLTGATPNKLYRNGHRLTRVALGKVAEDWLEQQVALANRRALPHPQFWKRFHASERDRYVCQLREIRLAAG